jgi:hypothetical protein
MTDMIKAGTGGDISSFVQRCSWADDKYVGDAFNSDKPSSYYYVKMLVISMDGP